MATPTFLQLKCGTNNYEWGSTDPNSRVVRYAAATPGFEKKDEPYSEMWMGTHPTLPSHDLASGRPLADLLAENPELMGAKVQQAYESKLPFLFKIMSIGKILPFQAHPDKEWGHKLHIKDPKQFVDPNHKPEIAIALSHFAGFSGFRPLKQIISVLKAAPIFAEFPGAEATQTFISTVSGNEESEDKKIVQANKAALRQFLHAILTQSTSRIEEYTKKLLDYIASPTSTFGPHGADLPGLLRLIHTQYGADPGLFSAPLLNCIFLKPGEYIYIGADEPHAYITGEIVECMASSDNVVNAGFCPPSDRNPDLLMDILTFEYLPKAAFKLDPKAKYAHSLLYDPPIDEFAILATSLAPGQTENVDPIAGPSIMVFTKGKGRMSVGGQSKDVKEGEVYFVKYGEEVALEAQKGDYEAGLEAYRCYTDLN
ncbi:Mannose-6-phosphate isomerase [Saitoella coloradoensis]